MNDFSFSFKMEKRSKKKINYNKKVPLFQVCFKAKTLRKPSTLFFFKQQVETYILTNLNRAIEEPKETRIDCDDRN